VELLVVMSIIAILASLLMPAVNAVRERGRQTQCMSNQRNVAIAMTSHDNQKGKLPGWANDLNPRQDVAGVLCTPVGWAFPLLPYLERNDLYQPLSVKNPGTRVTIASLIAPNVVPQLPILLCPNDATAKNGPTTSYVGNCGYPDNNWRATALNTRGASASHAANYQEGIESAVFHNNYGRYFSSGGKQVRYPYTESSIAIVSAGDGSAQTLMISENIDASFWHGGAETQPLGSTESYEASVCFCWVDSALGSYPNDFRPNAKINSFPGRAPRLSSYHPSGVLVAYCDTHTQFVNESIDPLTLVLLHSPRGRTARQPWSPNSPTTSPAYSNYVNYILDESKVR